jgi:hypothetical protein
MFKEDSIIYINQVVYKTLQTGYVWYSIYEDEYGENYINEFHMDNFITFQEWREQRINKILEND